MKPLTIALGFSSRIDDFIPNYIPTKLYSDSSSWAWALLKQLQDKGIKTCRFHICNDYDYGEAYFYHSEQDRYAASLDWEFYRDHTCFEYDVHRDEHVFNDDPPDAVILEHQCFDPIAYINQNKIIKQCAQKHVPLFIIDSYGQLDEIELKHVDSLAAVLDFGNKWSNTTFGIHVEKPIYYKNLFDIKPYANAEADTLLMPDIYGLSLNLKYNGIDKKLLPESGVTIAAACSTADLEDQKEGIAKYKFLTHSLTQNDYDRSYAVALAGDAIRSKYGIISSHFIDCLIYGAIPMFYKDNTRVDVYCPDFLKDPLLFSDLSDYKKVKAFSYQEKLAIIKALREHVEFMDAKYFVETVLRKL